jgi:hypothetical protein
LTKNLIEEYNFDNEKWEIVVMLFPAGGVSADKEQRRKYENS